jgi:hypothetical protein
MPAVPRAPHRFGRVGSRACLIGPSFACPAQEQGKPLCFYFPAPRGGGGGGDEGVGYRWRRRAGSDAGSGPVAAAAPAPVVPVVAQLQQLPAPLPCIGGGSSVEIYIATIHSTWYPLSWLSGSACCSL